MKKLIIEYYIYYIIKLYKFQFFIKIIKSHYLLNKLNFAQIITNIALNNETTLSKLYFIMISEKGNFDTN